MRGQWVLVGLVFAALAAPGAAAVLPEDQRPSTNSVPNLAWLVPSFGYGDHPVHAAVGAYAGDGLEGHQDMSILITLDDDLLFQSDAIHEHDGFHTIVVTPPTTGLLRFMAYVPAYPRDPAHTVVVTAEVPILPGAPHPWTDEVITRLHPTFHQVEEHNIAFMGNEHLGHQAFVDVADSEGRLILHTVPKPNSWHANFVPAPPGGLGQGHVRALMTSFPTINQTVFTESISADLDFEETPTVRVSNAIFYGTESLPSCADSGVPILTDPASAIEEGLAWQTWTDVRFALETTDHLEETDPEHLHGRGQPPAAEYQFFAMSPMAPVIGGTQFFMSYQPYDPFRQLTLRFREPGTYTMTVTRDSFAEPECRVDFTILPNTDSDPGHVVGEVEVSKQTAHVTFQALRDGTALSHYEFDTRVVKLHTEDAPGRLVWKGKLHGHDGSVAFDLAGLDAGDYEVRTYPSPEMLGTPPVAADSEDGFVYRFTVDHEAEPEAVVPPVDTETTPGLGPILLVALAALAAIAARRR